MKITNETDVQVVVCIHLYLASVFISTPEGHWRDEVFPRKWLDYSAQGHGIMHSSCRAHTAMTLAFWVRGRLELAAGTDTQTVGSRRPPGWQAPVQLLPQTGMTGSSPSLQTFSVLFFWLFGCVQIEHRDLHTSLCKPSTPDLHPPSCRPLRSCRSLLLNECMWII